MTNFKSIPNNYDIGIMMNNHRRKMEEVGKKKTNNRTHSTIAYKDLFQ